MEKYKIFISSKLGATMEQDLILACDRAAIRHGQDLATPAETLEVWRAEECIFRSEELGMLRPSAPKFARQ